jgi:hypothetical protein
MGITRRLLHDFARLPYHYNVVTLYSLLFESVLPLIGLGCIALGLLVAGYAYTDSAGAPHWGVRRAALAGALSVVGMALYVVMPIWLDALGLTASQGHIRFYGMFFLPVGALAGVLAVMVGSARRLAARDGRSPAGRFSVPGYIIGFVVMWPLFLAYSELMLGATMVVQLALVRATVTAALGALLFAVAPYLIQVVEPRPWKRLVAWGYGLLAAGAIALVVAQATTLVLNLHVDVL